MDSWCFNIYGREGKEMKDGKDIMEMCEAVGENYIE